MAGPAPAPLAWRLATVVDVVPETARARTLRLDVPGWPGHRAGQHVDVRLTAEDGYQAQRSYSIASAPGNGWLSLTVERLGDGEVSPYLSDELRAGDRLELRGPIGGYFVWEGGGGSPLLLVAGGSGVVPLMAMLRHRAVRRRDGAAGLGPARLLYSARGWDDLLYRDELARLADADPTLRVVLTLTRTAPEGWTGYRHRIDRDMLAAEGFSPSDGPDAFVCGPTAMVEAAAAALVELGHDPMRVRTERFGPT